jgi:N-acetylmuramoyl-L-alanine amidase
MMIMGYKTKILLANRRNYGSKRSTRIIKFLVYHYTANDGDTDEANAKYFHNNIVKASAHRFVDDDSVTISVPDNYVAYHCGGGLQGREGHKFYKICTNTNSIGIEMCDTIKNGKYEVSSKTRSNAIALGKEIVKKYGIKKENVIRHYDVTGKNCPAYFVKDEEAWKKFRDEIFETKKKEFKTYHIKVTANVLNVREGAGTNYKVVKTIKKGEKWLIRDEKNGWGKIRIGWIKLSYTKKV